MSESDGASGHRALSAPPRPALGGALLVRLPRAGVVVPQECACCGGAATHPRVITDSAARALLVGYCAECAAHVARHSTRRLASLLSSALLAVALALALPIVQPGLSALTCSLLSLAGGALPLLPALLLSRPCPGHASLSHAAWFVAPSELVCRRPEFARAFSALQTVEIVSAPARKLRVPLMLLPSLLAGVVLAPLLHVYQHPRLRIVNANDQTLTVSIDGATLGDVEPSASESSAAGLSTRVPAGERVLVARDASARVLAEARVTLLPGRDHLYAPGAPTTCFWLERTQYGRSGARSERIPLEGALRFWALPEEVSGWFVPSPPPVEGARTTGGTATVVRQGPCDDVPALQ